MLEKYRNSLISQYMKYHNWLKKLVLFTFWGGLRAAKLMGLHAAKLWLGSPRKYQNQPLGLDCEESCFIKPKNTSVSLVRGYQTIKKCRVTKPLTSPLKGYGENILYLEVLELEKHDKERDDIIMEDLLL